MQRNELQRQQKRRLLRAPRGQSMVEYSVISHFILFSGTLFLLPVITQLFQGLTKFYDSVYTVIQTAAL